jgi:hypothetical protein
MTSDPHIPAMDGLADTLDADTELDADEAMVQGLDDRDHDEATGYALTDDDGSPIDPDATSYPN